MKHHHKLIYLLIGLFCLPIYAQNTTYFIQLGSYKHVQLNDFEDVKKFGSLYVENTEQETQRLLLGQFFTKKTAQQVLIDLKKIGWKKAFITRRHPLDFPQVYVIQLAAYQQKMPPLELQKWQKYGTLYSQHLDKNNIFTLLIGAFLSKKEAQKVQQQLKVEMKKETLLKRVNSDELLEMAYISSIVSSSSKPILKKEVKAKKQFKKVDFLNKIKYFKAPEANEKIVISGELYPLSLNNLLFKGTMKYETDMYGQSLLLYSENGGKNWKETLTAAYGEDIIQLQFVSSTTAFLVMMGVVEGPGTLSLFKTNNKGKTWQKISQIPKPQHDCIPAHIYFSDEKRGIIMYWCDSSGDGIWAWETQDGGQNWTVQSQLDADQYTEIIGYNEAQRQQKNYHVADKWQQEQADNAFIFKQKNEVGKWQKKSRLAKYYQLKNGVILEH